MPQRRRKPAKPATEAPLLLHRVRQRGGALVRALPVVRGVEHRGRGAGRPRRARRAAAAAARARAGRRAGGAAAAPPGRARSPRSRSRPTHRWPSGLRELDRVLGGGVVPGSLVLVGGDPGIGKSTLLLQLAGDARRGGPPRALRLGRGERGAGAPARRAARPDPRVAADPVRDRSRGGARGGGAGAARRADRGLDPDAGARRPRGRPGLGHAGARVRRSRCCTTPRARRPRSSWSGTSPRTARSPGPRVLEHMVDAVLYLEGERYQHYRVLRAAKNRFGSTQRAGRVRDDRRRPARGREPERGVPLGVARGVEPGTAVVASLEGTRPLLVEVQALVVDLVLRHAAARHQRVRPAAARGAARGARAARRACGSAATTCSSR